MTTWNEPDGVHPRGTLVVLAGRGEHPGVYARFGRRIAADGYRVHVLTDATGDESQVRGALAAVLTDSPTPHVLVGSDSGALLAAGLVAQGEVDVAALVLAGLPVGAGKVGEDWEDEVAARTACPTHQALLTGDTAVRRGALSEPPPTAWTERADPTRIGVPVLGLHGAADDIAPLEDARQWYARAPQAELVAIANGRHDALNDQTHRTAAATVVLFLERLRAGGPAIAVPIDLHALERNGVAARA